MYPEFFSVHSQGSPVHHTTAQVLLQYLARQELVKVEDSTFVVDKYPQPVIFADVIDSFRAIQYFVGAKRSELKITSGSRLEAWTSQRLFDILFRTMFVSQRLYPVVRSSRFEGDMGAPLPNLFVGAEKTQVRQIPLVEDPPWPFRFLLELGGMVVCRPRDRLDFLKELRQFLNNHPQFVVKVDVKTWPDGSQAVYTWWFEALSKRREIRGNVNVESE